MDASRKKLILIIIASCSGFLLVAALGWLLYFNAQFSVYQDDKYKFSIRYPSNWKVVERPEANVAVLFLRPKDTALDALQENFNVTIQPVSEEDRSLAVLNGNVKNQMTAVFGKNIKVVEDTPVHWGWRLGHRMSFEAPVPNQLKLVNAWLLRGDEVYILTFLGQMDKYGRDAVFVNEMIHSLKFE